MSPSSRRSDPVGEVGNALLALAGAAITLAGFSGLMLAFRSGRGKLNLGQNIAVRILMMTGISGMIFAVIPIPFLLGALRGDILWGVMLGLLGLHFLYFALVVPFDLRRRKVKLTVLFLAFVTIHALAGFLMLAGAFDVGGFRDASLFVGGVVWLIVIAASQLLVQIFGMLSLAPIAVPSKLEGAEHAD